VQAIAIHMCSASTNTNEEYGRDFLFMGLEFSSDHTTHAHDDVETIKLLQQIQISKVWSPWFTRARVNKIK